MVVEVNLVNKKLKNYCVIKIKLGPSHTLLLVLMNSLFFNNEMITTPIFRNTPTPPSPLPNIVLFNCPVVASTTFKSEKRFVLKIKNKIKKIKNKNSHNSEKLIGCNELIACHLNQRKRGRSVKETEINGKHMMQCIITRGCVTLWPCPFTFYFIL